jgi:uncharacterized protein YndB with AHSA1/START domain
MKIDRSTPVIIEQEFNCSPETVWNVLTYHPLMIQWYFNNIPDFKPKVGFETQFNVKSTTRDFLHIWKVTEVIPFKKLVYDWTFEGIKGKSTLTFELEENNSSTLLKVISIGLDSFPEDIPEFTYESCLGGWNYFIKEQLVKFLIKE